MKYLLLALAPVGLCRRLGPNGVAGTTSRYVGEGGLKSKRESGQATGMCRNKNDDAGVGRGDGILGSRGRVRHVGRGGTGRICAVELKQGRRNQKAVSLGCFMHLAINVPQVLHL